MKQVVEDLKSKWFQREQNNGNKNVAKNIDQTVEQLEKSLNFKEQQF